MDNWISFYAGMVTMFLIFYFGRVYQEYKEE